VAGLDVHMTDLPGWEHASGPTDPESAPDFASELARWEAQSMEARSRGEAPTKADQGSRRRRDLFDALIALGAGAGPTAALRRITDVAREVTGARYALFAPSPAARGVVPHLVRSGVFGDPPPPGLSAVLSDPHELVGDGQPVRLADLRDHPHRADLPHDLPEGVGLLVAPILADGELYGELLLFSRPGGGFSDDHERAMITVTAATGVVVATAALRAEAERRQRWLDASADVVAALLVHDAPEQVLELVVRRAVEVDDADLAAIVAPAALSGRLVVQVAAGTSAERIVGLQSDSSGTPIGDVLRTGTPQRLAGRGAQLQGWQPQTPDLAVLDGPCLLVPFAAERRPLGVLVVARQVGRPGFEAADVGLASMFAAHAGLAVEFTRAQRDREWLAVLEDRDRIARDLHDLVIQRLFVAGLRLQGMARTIEAPEVAQALEQTVDELDRTVTEIRRSIFSLRSPLVGRDGLRARLLALCGTATAPLGFEPRVQLEGPLDTVVPDAVGEQLIAVLREALANATRHARATEVNVQARTNGSGVLLEVADNGIGLDPTIRRRAGLTGIARRAEELGGTLRIASPPTGGTVLTWEIPLSAH
jgi:signal transduction histidine kinase